ncbi:semaphorin-7A-like isoform X1 [Cetorhinus maximus]
MSRCLWSGFSLLLLLISASAPTSPRLKLDLRDEIQKRFKFESSEEYATTLREGSTVYVGGNEILYQINFDKSPNLVQKISVSADPESKRKCLQRNLGHCENAIMVLQKFNRTHLLLCGTNAREPRCWLLLNNEPTPIINGGGRHLGQGVCPFTPKHGFTSLVEEGRFYSVAPLHENGNGLHLRGFKKETGGSWLLSVDEWLTDPNFVGMSPIDDQIFMFFREKNMQKNLDIDPWMSRVAQVCKDDKGGSRQRLQHKWATFLKARLLCSVPTDHVNFNRIQDVYVAKSNNSEDRVYGIFKSNWNGAAICTYSVRDINNVFRTSKFKGFSEDIPNPRPGTCDKDTQGLPDIVLNVIENHPEMVTNIQPIGKAPLVIEKADRFKKIVVDSVVDFNGKVSWVLFLAMGNGKIQKVLEIGQSVFTISELEVLKEPGPILSMSLDSESKLLYVTTAKELIRFPLTQCEKYAGDCASCVMARDPYCAWNPREKKCVPSTTKLEYFIQDLENGDHKKCPQERVGYHRSSERVSEDTNLVLPLEGAGPVYLSCPKQSHHADYSWKVQDKVEACSSNGDECLLFIKDISEVNSGHYMCNSNERGHEQLHISYYIQGSGSSIYLSRYSVAVYSILMTVAALFLH